MATTIWNPATKVSRGNIILGIVPTIATLTAPTAIELGAITDFTCSTETFNATSETDSTSVDFLCTTDSEQLPGATTHSMDDITIKVSGQADDSLYTALAEGDPVYVIRRDGLPSTQAIASGDMVWVWRCVVTSVDPAEANNPYLANVLHVTVLARTPLPVAVV